MKRYHMNIRKLFAACGLAAFVAGNAHATCTSISCDNETIIGMMTTTAGDVYIKTSGTMTNLGCTLSQGVYITLPVANNPRFKELYASLLAHHMADRPLSIRINDGSVGCTIAYIMAS